MTAPARFCSVRPSWRLPLQSSTLAEDQTTAVIADRRSSRWKGAEGENFVRGRPRARPYDLWKELTADFPEWRRRLGCGRAGSGFTRPFYPTHGTRCIPLTATIRPTYGWRPPTASSGFSARTWSFATRHDALEPRRDGQEAVRARTSGSASIRRTAETRLSGVKGFARKSHRAALNSAASKEG